MITDKYRYAIVYEEGTEDIVLQYCDSGEIVRRRDAAEIEQEQSEKLWEKREQEHHEDSAANIGCHRDTTLTPEAKRETEVDGDELDELWEEREHELESTGEAGWNSDTTFHPCPSPALNPVSSPLQNYPGWLATAIAPLICYISQANPRTLYQDREEIHEGYSGSVFSAQLTLPAIANHGPRLPVEAEMKDKTNYQVGMTTVVAIKSLAILPTGSQKKIQNLKKELEVLDMVRHKHIMSKQAVYLDLVEDALWITMDLMEMSLTHFLTTITRLDCFWAIGQSHD
ncbi:hypothetical protein H0H87_009821 [Tephrocybe sp. NHM501043]|nr:hypothetical protein H0H87_009821 [Tephrocybe sp. NHM501043]